MGFDSYNRPLNIWESNGTPTPKMGIHLGVQVFILTLSHTPFWHAPLQVLPLVARLRLGLRHEPLHKMFNVIIGFSNVNNRGTMNPHR
jgi:hypothetical protein